VTCVFSVVWGGGWWLAVSRWMCVGLWVLLLIYFGFRGFLLLMLEFVWRCSCGLLGERRLD